MLRQKLLRLAQLQRETAAAAARAQRRQLSSAGTPPPAPVAKAAESAEADAKLRAEAEAKLRLDGAVSGMLFPWERSQFGDRTEGLKWWQKAYWVGFACVMTYWVGEKGYNKATTGKWRGDEPLPPSAPRPRVKPTLLKSRVNEALRGESFMEEDDPLEGLSPAEIEALVAKEAPGGDAFDGLSPEEINEYLAREQAEREAALAD